MGAYVTINPTPSGDITGSGTPNYLAMFTSANVIGDSVIYQSGSKVYVSAANTFAVNTSTPSFSVGYDSQTITIAGVSYSAIESSYISAGTSVNSQAMAASATASVASVYLGARSRGTFASPTAVQSGDSLHSFYSVGHDGTDYAIATAVEHIVGGTVGANQVPGRIKFSTANSSGTLTEAMSIYSTQQVNIGNYASPTDQRLVTIGQDTSWMSFGSLVGTTSQPAIYLNQATPSPTNYTITSDGSNVYLNTQSTTGFCYITTGNNTRFYFGRSGMASNFAADISGATTTFSFITPAHTGQTASTEITNFKVTGNTKTWANGGAATTIPIQRWNYFTANTAATSGGGSLTITDSFGLYAEAAVASGVAITNNWAIGASGSVQIKNVGTSAVSLNLDGSAATGGSTSFNILRANTGVSANIIFSTSTTNQWTLGLSGFVSTNDFVLRDAPQNATRIQVLRNTVGQIGLHGVTPTALLTLAAGTATASTAPLKFTTGTNLSVAEAGAMEYNNTFHLTNSDATRRHVVLAPNTTKVTAAAPYANDGYIVINIGGTDFKVMTTA